MVIPVRKSNFSQDLTEQRTVLSTSSNQLTLGVNTVAKPLSDMESEVQARPISQLVGTPAPPFLSLFASGSILARSLTLDLSYGRC